MTDIIATAPIAIRRRLPRLQRPKLGLGAALAAISGAVGHAFSMAYVAPYGTTGSPPALTPKADLEGRDPTW